MVSFLRKSVRLVGEQDLAGLLERSLKRAAS
jgi:hypothetical protein